MIALTFAAFLLMAGAVALTDWKRGWLLAIVCIFLQDPARKMTPGTPIVMTVSVIAIYAVIIFTAQHRLQRQFNDFARRFPNMYGAALLFVFFLILAVFTGIFTYGIELWKVPALSLFVYTAPVPAVFLGYAFADDEEDLLNVFRVYAVVTSIGLIGTPLEYLKVQWSALGMVGLPEGFIRHLPGIQIRILSGFYRAPDIMGWHASMLTIVGIFMTVRARALQRAWPWMCVAGWGFLNTMLSGRRKAVYMTAVFGLVFIWRYLRRLTITQLVSAALVGVLMALVVHNLMEKEESSVYARGTVTTSDEIFERLEGGLFETVRQFGFMGAGLGTATQGARHLLGHDENIGWQEGGLGKLAVEIGVPGVLAAAILAAVGFRMMLKITAYRDLAGTSQVMRCALFGIVAANAVNFMVSAQAYSDAGLTLHTAFFVGCLLGTAKHDEVPAEAAVAERAPAVAVAPA